MVETHEEYTKFLENIVIEELIKEFNFNCKLEFIGRKEFGGSNLWEYSFKDEFGIIWKRDVPYKVWFEIACRSPKMRARITE